MTLAVDMVKELGLPAGIVVNRAGIGDGRIREFCEKANIEILLTIPDDRRIAEAYSRGEMAFRAVPEYKVLFVKLLTRIEKEFLS